MRAKELIDFLTAEGFNVFPDPNFIPSEIEESHLPALFVLGTGGFGSDGDLPIDNPTFQVVVKGKSYRMDVGQMDATEHLAKQLIDSLDKRYAYTIGSSHVFMSRAVQSNPIPIGLDENDRPVFSTNFFFKTTEV